MNANKASNTTLSQETIGGQHAPIFSVGRESVYAPVMMSVILNNLITPKNEWMVNDGKESGFRVRRFRGGRKARVNGRALHLLAEYKEAGTPSKYRSLSAMGFVRLISRNAPRGGISRLCSSVKSSERRRRG